MTGPKTLAHTSATLQIWRRLRDLRNAPSAKVSGGVVLDGNSLDIASVVAVARHGVKPAISSDPDLARRIDLSVEALAAYIARDWVVYGVNTGFGGSAEARTADLVDLQIHLLQHTQSAIVTSADKDPAANSERQPGHVMPPEWVRGAIVACANQNLRGYSAMRLSVLRSLVDFLHHDMTPLVPLRGTISASDDLMPMSYIAGAVTGNPDVFAQRPGAVGPGPQGEALGLINGTAPSVAVASLVLHDAQHLALLAQMLTAMTAEALACNVEWSLHFIHAARPHVGQIEAAGNIRRFRGSEFVIGLESRKRKGDGLWQDRYSTHTAPQWLGPYLEDLLLAQRQLEVELNSTSDNPLVEAASEPPPLPSLSMNGIYPQQLLQDAAANGSAINGSGINGSGINGCGVNGDAGHGQSPGTVTPGSGEVYSGGNFQANVVTSAMDKTRLAIQMIGRLIFSQVTEMIGSSTNNGLDANLNASYHENYTMKGIDVNMAAYMSELAALAHPVSSHVISAEMHNQGINSLALLSARRTIEAADVLAHMCACHLYVSCQVIDLRANNMRFLDLLREQILRDTSHKGALHGLGLKSDDLDRLVDSLFPVIEATWYRCNAKTWRDRLAPVADAIVAPMTEFMAVEGRDCSVSQLAAIRKHFFDIVSNTAAATFHPGPVVPPEAGATRLGNGSARLYTWVRSRLGVPMHCGIVDDPLYNARRGLPTEKKTIGSWVGSIYENLLQAGFLDMMMEGIETALEAPRTVEAYETLCQEMQERYRVSA